MMIRDGARPRRVPSFTFYEPGDHLPLRLVDGAARQEVSRARSESHAGEGLSSQYDVFCDRHAEDSARFERNGERCYKPSQPSTVGVQQQWPGGLGSSPALPYAAKPLAERLQDSYPVLV